MCSEAIRVLDFVNELFLKLTFILIFLVLLAEISNSFASGVATENIYGLSLVPHFVESWVFLIEIIVSYIFFVRIFTY